MKSNRFAMKNLSRSFLYLTTIELSMRRKIKASMSELINENLTRDTYIESNKLSIPFKLMYKN